MLIIVDNTKNLKKAFMTPKLLKCLDQVGEEYIVVSDCKQAVQVLNSGITIDGAILSGGPMSLADEIKLNSINKNILVLLNINKPILGICFGLQIIGTCYGGKVEHMPSEKKEKTVVKIKEKSLLFNQLTELNVVRYHQDALVEVPENFKITATSNDGIIQGIECPKLNRWAVQFHPEGITESHQIIYNFIKLIVYKD